MVKVYNWLFYGVFVVLNKFIDVFGFDIKYNFVEFMFKVVVVKMLFIDFVE